MLKPSVEVREEDGFLVAEFWDCLRLDPAPVQELRKCFEAHMRIHGRPELVVDMRGVSFAGSAALGGFVAIHKLAKQHSGRLIFCNVDPTVLEVLRVSKLESLFTIVPDRAAALAAAADLAARPDAGHRHAPASQPATPPPDGARGRQGPAPPLRRKGRKP